MLAATILVVVLLAMHPELRLLAPLVDLLGIDVLVLLVGAQAWDLAGPAAILLRDRFAFPVLRRAYRLGIFMLGCMGTYVDAHLTMRFGYAMRAG